MSAGLRDELAGHGFRNISAWSRGVDTETFHPRRPGEPDVFEGLARPIFLYVGRVAVEKNLEAFLDLDLPGSKVVVGDGPARAALQRRYPDAHFLGEKFGAALAEIFASADAFVFPSKTDTFGNVMIEALASGVPVAAYPVSGPRDVLTDPDCAAMEEDLDSAIAVALISPMSRAEALKIVTSKPRVSAIGRPRRQMCRKRGQSARQKRPKRW